MMPPIKIKSVALALALLALAFTPMRCAAIPAVTSVGAHNEIAEAEAEHIASTQHHRALNLVTHRRWKERSGGRVIVPYTIDSTFGGSDRSAIENALEDLEKRTGSLKFVRRNNERHYIRVQRRSGSCSSEVGQSGNVQNLNLGTNCMSKSTIQHEFMHAIGVHHEQSRPDRDRYVEIRFNNIKDRRAKEHNFKKSNGVTLDSPYDYGSVMHYSETAFALPNTRTIVPRGGNTIRREGRASDLDIKKLKLMYQCERGIVRKWGDLVNNPCTSDCKCREDETGCGSNNDACHGNLVCKANKCVSGAEPPAPAPAPPSPSPGPGVSVMGPYLIWQTLPGSAADDFRCVDLKGRITSNGNHVWYYPCNFTPAQYWYRDSSNYIRSSVDKNKCLVGSRGSSALGTRLIINDCHVNDDRFRWDIYTDGSIRPRNNKWVCIEAIEEGEGDGHFLMLDECNDEYKSFQWLEPSGRRELLPKAKDGDEDNNNVHDLRSSTESYPVPDLERRTFESEMQGTFDYSSANPNECDDSPVGWYDIFGRNCEWYGEVESNCAVYGDQYANFGRTALSACCVCGGGQSSLEEEFHPHAQDQDSLLEMQQQAVGEDQTQACWDEPNWYDSTGDGCAWYEEEHNCEYFGDQFWSVDGLTANEACCACGGGLSSAPAVTLADENETPGCSDSPFDWFDEYGNGCDWYSLDDQNCIEFGDFEGADGKTPNEACCVCGGGLNPNPNASVTAPESKDKEEGDGNMASTTPAPAPMPTSQPSSGSGSGTCGNGNRGNGVCADGTCCSKWGWCGTSTEHCIRRLRGNSNNNNTTEAGAEPELEREVEVFDLIDVPNENDEWNSTTIEIDVDVDEPIIKKKKGYFDFDVDVAHELELEMAANDIDIDIDEPVIMDTEN